MIKISELPSFIQAIRTYFSDRKVEIAEFKALTEQDKIELSAMLMPLVAHRAYVPPAK